MINSQLEDIGEKYGYKIKKSIIKESMGHAGFVQWMAHPGKFESGPKVKRPWLYSNKSEEHLISMIAFVAEQDSAHTSEAWNELFKNAGLE